MKRMTLLVLLLGLVVCLPQMVLAGPSDSRHTYYTPPPVTVDPVPPVTGGTGSGGTVGGSFDTAGLGGLGSVTPSLPTTVPEPLTLLLLGTGIAGLVALRRRMK